jgi:enterochelin esterase family protein
VLSQSGAFGSPLNEHPVIRAYRDGDRRPVRFFLDIGLYENAFKGLPINEQALAEGLTNDNRHFRDVLLATGYDVRYLETGGRHDNIHIRATLAEGLIALLGVAP